MSEIIFPTCCVILVKLCHIFISLIKDFISTICFFLIICLHSKFLIRVTYSFSHFFICILLCHIESAHCFEFCSGISYICFRSGSNSGELPCPFGDVLLPDFVSSCPCVESYTSGLIIHFSL